MGGGKKSKAPAAPDYSALATQDAEAQRKTAELLTKQNRPTQKDPLGNKLSWSQDANGNWTQSETWNPKITQGYNDALAMREKAMKEAQNAQFKGPAAVADYQNTAGSVADFDPNASGQAASQAMYDKYWKDASWEQGFDRQGMQTQLRQQGLQPGTEAYDRAYKNLLQAQGDTNTKAKYDSIILGGNEARQNYQSQLAGQGQRWQQGIGDYQTKMQGQDQKYRQADADYTRKWDTAGASSNLLNTLYRPTYQGFSGATGYNPADMLGASQAQYAAKMGGYNAQQQKKGNTMNTAASLGGSAMMAFSDAALKHDIKPLVGRDALEALLQLGGYTWRWNDSGEVDAGVLAQEVQRILPELVVKPDAFLMVNYTGLVALAIESIKYLAGELSCTQK